MAERLARDSDVGEYIPYHFNALQAQTPLDSNSHGHFFGGVLVGTLGTGLVISIYNGSTLLSKITPNAPDFFGAEFVCDAGLQIALAGTGFDITILALDMAV